MASQHIKNLTLAKSAAEIKFKQAANALAEAGNPADSDEGTAALDEWAAALEALTAATVALTEALAGQEAEPPREPDPAAAEDKSFSNSQGVRTVKPISKQQARQFNLSNFIMGAVDKSANIDCGYENEMSQEAAKKAGRTGMFIPWGAITKAQDTITAPSGGTDFGLSLAPIIQAADLFTIAGAASFRTSAAGQLGVPVYQAELGKFTVPRLVSPIIPAWVPRDQPVPDASAKFDALEMSPHTLGAVCEVRRSALIDTNPAMQSVIQDHVWQSILNALDSALLGSAPLPQDADQPDGLYQQLLSGTNDFGACTPAELLYALGDIADVNEQALGFIAANAWDAYASLTGVSTALNQSSLKANMPAAYARVLNGRMAAFNGEGTVGGAGNKNLHSMFGPFASMCHTVLFGPGVELMVNGYADSVYSKGAVLVRCIVDADVLCRDVSKFGLAYNQTVSA